MKMATKLIIRLLASATYKVLRKLRYFVEMVQSCTASWSQKRVNLQDIPLDLLSTSPLKLFWKTMQCMQNAEPQHNKFCKPLDAVKDFSSCVTQ